MRTLPAPAFPADRGEPDPRIRAALAAANARPGDTAAYLGALAELCLGRVLVPIVAILDHQDGDGGEKRSEMAVALVRAAAGTALPAFTGLDSLQSWRHDARPAPATLDSAARVARDERVTALLIDPAGPAPLVVEGDLLVRLASGHRLVRLTDGFGWAMPAGAEDAQGERGV